LSAKRESLRISVLPKLGATLRLKVICAVAIMAFAVSGCSLPRGAAVSSEVLREQNAENPGFVVVPVSRENVDMLAHWPVTGWKGSYNWIPAKGGPNSSAIQPGDLVAMIIWDNSENSLLTAGDSKNVDLPPMQVSPTGAVFVPYLGNVVVNGQTPDAAREQIQKRMEVIAPSVQVQLSVEPGVRNSVDLVSGVGKPGSYPMPDRNYSILSLLAEGGGISSALKSPLVRLMRGGKTYEIRADRLLAEADKNTTLRGGDKVLVREDERYFTALGATGAEKLIRFEQDRITALEAMSLVGGITDARANPEGVLVLRDYGPQALHADGIKGPSLPQVVFTFDLTTAEGLFAARKFQINPLDTVLATESPMVAASTILGLVGSVIGLNNAFK
jgi:polysaccharide export outer membrane protein